MDEYMLYIKRTLENFLQKTNEQFPALLITGLRQVGKTTVLRHLTSTKRVYVTLDDPELLTLAKEEPKLFFERFKPPILIDEIQYAPELLPIIKMYIDNDRTPGQFWLTGSQQFQLMKGVSESLAGRIVILNLLGLSSWEQAGLGPKHAPFMPTPELLEARDQIAPKKKSLPDFYREIWRGSFPSIALDAKIDWNTFYSSYVQTYLQRDVRDLAKIVDGLAFLRFLKAAAARTGQLLNLSDLARDVGVSPNTAQNWLSILQASGVVYLLEPYHTNITKRIIKAPKLYFLDTGLCCYLTGWSSPETLESGAMSGGILETFVVIEIIKSYWHNGKQAPIYYYRDKDKKEIDLLIVQDQIVYPLEIKKTASPTKVDTNNFSALKSLGLKIGHGGVICLASTRLPITHDITSIPVALI